VNAAEVKRAAARARAKARAQREVSLAALALHDAREAKAPQWEAASLARVARALGRARSLGLGR